MFAFENESGESWFRQIKVVHVCFALKYTKGESAWYIFVWPLFVIGRDSRTL